MTRRTVRLMFLALAFLLYADFSLAATAKSSDQAPGKPASQTKAAVKKKKESVPQEKRVDINSASKQELMKLPYVDEATADKIIAGRPYLSKAQLVSKKIIGQGPYQLITGQIIAKQATTPKPKPAAKK